MRLRGETELLAAVVGQRRVRHAGIRRARLLADVPGALEPFEEPGDPGGGQHDLLGEIDAAHHPAFGVREVQEHLVVVQGQVVLALQLHGQLARDRRVRAKERDPALEPDGRRDPGCHSHSCVLKCSARNGVGTVLEGRFRR